MSRTVELRVLPDGRVRIHWFMFDQAGPVSLPHGTTKSGVAMGGSLPDENGDYCSRGRIVCQPQRTSILPEKGRRGITRPVVHSDDPRAVTCPECQATEEWKAAMANLKELLNVGG